MRTLGRMRENAGIEQADKTEASGKFLPHLSAALTSSPAGGGTYPSVTTASGSDISLCRGGKGVPLPPEGASPLTDTLSCAPQSRQAARSKSTQGRPTNGRPYGSAARACADIIRFPSIERADERESPAFGFPLRREASPLGRGTGKPNIGIQQCEQKVNCREAAREAGLGRCFMQSALRCPENAAGLR